MLYVMFCLNIIMHCTSVYVESNSDLFDNFLCQKAEFASSFVKTLELPTLPRAYSTEGKG